MKKGAVAGSIFVILLVGIRSPSMSSQLAEEPKTWPFVFDFDDRATYRILLGSPRLVEGEYQISVTGAVDADLRTRPWMNARMGSPDAGATTWLVEVPRESPYAAQIENYPRTPVSGIMLDLRSSFRGDVQIDVSGRRFSFQPAEIQLGRPKDFDDGFLRVEKVPTVITAAGTTHDEDYPALLAASDGSLWLSWIEFDGRADRLRAARWEHNQWTDLGLLAGPGDLYGTRLAELNGGIWVIWSEQRDENWDLFARSFSSGKWSEAQRLTDNPYPDWNHEIQSDGSRLWVVWQTGRTAAEEVNWEIFLRYWEDGRWSTPLNISDHPSNDWEPALVARSGSAYVAWDSYRSRNYDIFLCKTDGETAGAIRPLVAGSGMEVRVDLAQDAQDRIWFSWEEAGPEWGLDSAAFERGLHRERKVRVGCLQGEQIYLPAAEPLSSPIPHLGPQSEMARLASDQQGRLWLFFRVNFLNRIWQQAATYLEGEKWSEPIVFDTSYGRQTAPLGLSLSPQGDLWIGWVSDTRVFDAPFNAIHNDIHLTRLPPVQRQPAEPELRSLDRSRPVQTAAQGRSWPDYMLQNEGARYRLVWGELHRHTDIDHHGRPDGALEDAYRYAFDVALLDFFASTDHIRGEPSRSGINPMTWWRSQKYADLHRLKGIFEPLYAYERAKPSPGGHKNLVFAERGGPLLKGTEGNNIPTDLWDALDRLSFPAVVIPHQLTGPAIDWQYHNPRYEPVMEIYQGRRQNYEYDGAPQPPGVKQIWGKKEGSWAWDALERGARLGFIASSDHGSTHMSYAAVYAEDLSRRAVLEALRARRTYAASDNIVLDFRLEMENRQLLMGEAARLSGQPKLLVKATGTGPIQTVEIIRNNRFVYTAHPNTRDIDLSFISTDAIEEDTCFYVRVIQEDGHMAWSSPIWLETTGPRRKNP